MQENLVKSTEVVCTTFEALSFIHESAMVHKKKSEKKYPNWVFKPGCPYTNFVPSILVSFVPISEIVE